MVSKTKKIILVYSMLILASLCHHGNAQQQQMMGTANKVAYPTQSAPFVPVGKGYSNQPLGGNLGYYYSHPINAQYWTGHGSQFIQSPQYLPQFHTQYQQPSYQQYPQQYYQQAWYQPNMYQQNGYQQYYSNAQYSGYPATQPGYYPSFDASYWHPSAAMNHNGQMMSAPVYPHQVPVYPHQFPVAQYPVYPGQYYPNAYHSGYPYRRPNLLDHVNGIVRSKTGKTLLGALAVGVVAGKIARKGK